MSDKSKQFKQALDDHHQWPCPYVYKFIVPAESLGSFQELFSSEKLETRQSKTGKYTSVTMTSTMCSADEVMAVYEKAARIPGIMSL
ncbi:hypothetical protein BerOc1_03649 [Pseudodesulfovibrio hydrargyri]|uniref:DUF493 domain-containing protein n=1 Tax=Pseudodesulfovibrio hydrargyri TaxID=2125990 RepID=A0A1J5N262_9BACT|nr:DUF493 family protein [Pseudodesulfovibrio hydrargyri]OIQ48896.1 hypothetical protein BerOc1_03649 [Pseudodesulfovibrio hydrargyri]